MHSWLADARCNPHTHTSCMHSSLIPGERTENWSTASSQKSTAILQPLHWPLALLRRCFHTYTYTHTHIHTHTCPQVYSRARTHARIHANIHTHMHIHIHTHTQARTHTHMHTQMHTHTHTHMHTHTHTHMHTHTCTHAHTRMREHTHTRVHTHTHIHVHTHVPHAHVATHACTQKDSSWWANSMPVTHCNALRNTAPYCNTLQHITHCNTLQHRSRRAKSSTRATSSTTASDQLFATKHYATTSTLPVFFLPLCNTHCNTLQYTYPSIRYNTLWDHFDSAGLLYHTTTHCNALQHTATHRPSHLLQYSMRPLQLC